MATGGCRKGFVRVMSWSLQRSPQAPASLRRYLPFSTARRLYRLHSNNCLPGHTLPHSRHPAFPPFSQQVKSIRKRTLLIFLVCPIILGFLITHLIFNFPVKIFDRSRPFSLSNHQQPCHNLRVISRRESRLLVAKRTV